jgi:hypothetical protein
MFLKMMRKKREYDLAVIAMAIIIFSMIVFMIVMMILLIVIIGSAIF